jgi:hypothetical protein
VIQSSVAMTRTLVGMITALREGIATFDRQIKQAVAAHPDFAIWDSFPGAGPALAPRLLAAFGSWRDRYRTAAEMQQFSDCSRPGTERKDRMGSLPLGLSEVSATDFS